MGFWTLDLVGEMERMRRDLDRFLDDTRSSTWSLPFSRISFLPGRAARAYPLINIGEDENHVYVDALAPGVDPDSLNVSVTGDQLVISGNKKPLPDSLPPQAIHRSERSAGPFSRSTTLPAGVDSDKVDAKYCNGVLQITLPKAEAAKPRQIRVSVA